MNKEARFVYVMVGVSLLLVGSFFVLWTISSKRMRASQGKSNITINRYVSRDIPTIDSTGEARKFTDLKGKVWLVSHVFTRCPGQCAGVCIALDELRKEVRTKEKFHLVSVTLDPEHDSPDHLKQFTEKHGFVQDDWWFLTGEAEELNEYMLDVFSLSAQKKPESERDNPNDLFTHRPMVALVDHNLKLRGWYDPFDAKSADALQENLIMVLAEAESSH